MNEIQACHERLVAGSRMDCHGQAGPEDLLEGVRGPVRALLATTGVEGARSLLDA